MATGAVVILPAPASSPLPEPTTTFLTMDTTSSAEASSRSSPLSSASNTPFETIFEVESHTPLPPMNLTELRSLSDEKLTALNALLAQLSPSEILRWLFQQKLGKVVQFTSFGISGMVITDIASKLGITTPIVFVDTLYHFDEVQLAAVMAQHCQLTLTARIDASSAGSGC